MKIAATQPLKALCSSFVIMAVELVSDSLIFHALQTECVSRCRWFAIFTLTLLKMDVSVPLVILHSRGLK